MNKKRTQTPKKKTPEKTAKNTQGNLSLSMGKPSPSRNHDEFQKQREREMRPALPTPNLNLSEPSDSSKNQEPLRSPSFITSQKSPLLNNNINFKVESSALLPQPSSQRNHPFYPHPIDMSQASPNEKFQAICYELKIDKETLKIAKNLFEASMKQSFFDIENINGWIACSLYTATVETHSLSLVNILERCQIRANVFSRFLQHFLQGLSLGQLYEQKRKILEKKYVIGSILIKKFTEIYPQVLHYRPHVVEYSDLYKFTWNLSLFVREKLLSRGPDLLTSFHLLLCCIDFTFIHAKEILRIVQTTENIQNTNHILGYLCQISSASMQDVQHFHDTAFLPYIKSNSQSFHFQKEENSQVQNYPFKNFLTPGNLSKNLAYLEKEYEFSIFSSAELDERLFLAMPDILKTPKKGNASQIKRLNEKDSPKKINLHSPISQVPDLITNISWIKEASSVKQPSPNLKYFISECTEANQIEKQMNERIEDLTKSLNQVLKDTNVESDLKNSGTHLYYRILESMITAESKRLNQVDFTTLLSHDIFQKSLLACAFEIALYSYQPKNKTLSFPFILNIMNLQPFDFCKIIESVVRHEPTLTKSLVRHLSTIEEQILESYAWEEKSPLLALLKDPGNVNTLKSIGGLSEGVLPSSPQLKLSGNSSTISALASPKIKTNPNLSSPQRQKGSHSLELFGRKVFHLAHLRTKDLCCRLSIRPKNYQQIWMIFVQAIIEHSSLLVNRHLDQVMITCIYGVCRFLSLEQITFKAIIDQYKQQPQAKSHNSIWRNVLINDSQRGDIIQYYNRTFIPEMEHVIFTLNSNPESSHFVNSSNNISTSHNIYLSPLKTPPKLPQNKKISYEGSPAKNNIEGLNERVQEKIKTSRIKLFDDVHDDTEDESE